MIKIYPSVKKIGISLFRLGIIAFAAIMLMRAPEMSQTVSAALDTCIKKVLPALFPYMVVSSLIISSGIADRLGKKASAPFARLFALPGQACAVLLIGLLAGFPVGAKSACELYRSGSCTREQAQRLCAFCNNTGPAFIIGGIGVGFFGDMRTGVILYIIECISVIIMGLLLSLGKDRSRKVSACASKFTPDFSGAVTGAAISCVYVCAFVVFFAVIIKTVGEICRGSLAFLLPAINATLEVTAGTQAAAQIGGAPGFVLAAFAVGFGGVCVAAQSAPFMSEAGLKMAPYIKSKLAQGMICALLAAGWSVVNRL